MKRIKKDLPLEEMELAETQAFCEKMGMSEIPLQVQFLLAMQEGGAADVDIQGPLNKCNICKNVVNGLIATGAGGACGSACAAAGCGPCVRATPSHQPAPLLDAPARTAPPSHTACYYSDPVVRLDLQRHRHRCDRRPVDLLDHQPVQGAHR